ncbi:MAG: CBS domain-containing protein [Pacificimonas sp.]
MYIATLLEGRGDVVTVTPDQTVQSVVDILVKHRIGAVLVLEGDAIAGILSERDVVRCLSSHGPGILNGPARDIMTKDVVTITKRETNVAALANMTRRRIRHLPVVEDARLIGIVSIGDIVKSRIEEAEREAESLKDYIQHA